MIKPRAQSVSSYAEITGNAAGVGGNATEALGAVQTLSASAAVRAAIALATAAEPSIDAFALPVTRKPPMNSNRIIAIALRSKS